MKRSIPLWVTIVASLMTIGILAFSVNLAVYPKTFFPDTDFLIKDVRHFTAMWAMRQFSLGALLAYSLIRQSGQTLKIALALVFVINLFTIVEGVYINKSFLVIESVIYCCVSTAMIIAIVKKENSIKMQLR
jgi:peptidoglycan/LPS O-acetylase OafA/YrhL